MALTQVDSRQIKYTSSGTGAITRSVEATLNDFVVFVAQFGAVGDGVADDTDAFIAAHASLPANGGVIELTPGKQYRIRRTLGVNDRWGFNITKSNVTLRGNGSSIRRYATDISTYALAYPIVFIGTPDSNVADSTDNVSITGVWFIGEDTRHITNGSALHDGRYAIEAKNTRGLKVTGNRFTQVDSGVIWYQKPAEFNYANSGYYNTTKNYSAEFTHNECDAEEHTIAGRALIHAVHIAGLDGLRAIGNRFSWCDNALSGECTYEHITDAETDTYTDSNLGATVRRHGRDWVITGNNVYNSSEHAFYIEGMDVTIEGNTLRTDNVAVCNSVPIQVRGKGVAIGKNTISGYKQSVRIAVPSFNVTVDGNPITVAGDSSGGVIDIDSHGLSAYIAARSDYLTDYIPMHNIIINGNPVTMTESAQTGQVGYAVRIYTDSSDANFPDGQLQDVIIDGNTIRNHKYGVYIVGTLMRGIKIIGNVFRAKPFTATGFSASTTMGTEAIVVVNDSSTAALQHVSFDGNDVTGANYLFSTLFGGGSSVSLPWGQRGNTLRYIKEYKSADMAVVSWYSKFNGNIGDFFLERSDWFGNGAYGNSLGDGISSNSYKKSGMLFDGTNVRFYYDDVNSYKPL